MPASNHSITKIIDPLSRQERKQRTRSALLSSALRMMESGRSFGAISLREIAAGAGVVPASFYRHFASLDELGFALVEESGLTLRRLLRDVRRTGLPPKSMLQSSVQIYKKYIEDHRAHFVFVCSERSGGSPALRAAIRREEAHFCHEMAADLRQLGLMANASAAAVDMTCELVVGIMMLAATELLDLPKNQASSELDWNNRFLRQLRLIFLGAGVWRDAQ